MTNLEGQSAGAQSTWDPPWWRRHWAKTTRSGRMPRHQDGAPQELLHLQVNHALDVAGVAVAFLRARSGIGRLMGRLLGAGPDAVECLVARMAYIHDIGKLWAPFQAQAPWACAVLGTAPQAGQVQGEWRHDNIGLAILTEWEAGVMRILLGEEIDPDAEFLLASAAACHHGRPTDPASIRPAVAMSIRGTLGEDARAMARTGVDVFPGVPALPVGMGTARSFSLALAAVIQVADAIASNQAFFPWCGLTRTDPLAYWGQHALPQAERAVRELGLAGSSGGRRQGFTRLFPHIGKPTPLQSMVDRMPLPDGQLLVFVEDATGAGKTEAAQALAARMMGRPGLEGIFFALPTMATADAQARRQSALLGTLLGEDASMTVAHSGRPSRAWSPMRGGGDDAATWLQDTGRRRLLADLCVGTIDQGILAALPTKWAPLRIAGLLGKVVVVDESHAYDSYTGTLLGALLRLHAALGGSAILLSATLPAQTKAELALAFAAGAGWDPPEQAARDGRFPLVSVVSRTGVSHHAPGVSRAAAVRRRVIPVHSEGQAEQLVLRAAAAGHCVAWIRNTVDQAIAAGQALGRRWKDVTILHSRFAESDRMRIADGLIERFGPDSTATQRRGGIVVATSVIEQSLDIDFDVLLVDLRPMEGILQAMGRQRRHPRTREGDRIEGDDQRGDLPVLVLMPEPVDDPDERWYRSLLGVADFVHRDTAVLWRTARMIASTRMIAGEQGRLLVDAVHGGPNGPGDPGEDGQPGPMPAPDVFAERAGRQDAVDAYAQSLALAAHRDWGPRVGYRISGARADDEECVATRLGDSIEAGFVRWTPDGLVPYAGEEWRSGFFRVSERQAGLLDFVDRYSLPQAIQDLGRPILVMGAPGPRPSWSYSPTSGLSLPYPPR